MGGGGYDHWDWEADREREALNHRCTSVDDQIKRNHNTKQLKQWRALIEAQLAKIENDELAKLALKSKEQAFQEDLDMATVALRKKHGL